MINYKWKYCPTCEIMTIICPVCGNNMCNGGSGNIDDEDCPACELSHEYMTTAYVQKSVPDFPENKEELDIKHREFLESFKT